MTFERNDGQVSPRYRFLSRHEGVEALFSAEGPDFVVSPGAADARRLEMRFLSAGASPVIEGEHPLTGRANYLRGRQVEKWITSIPTFGQLRYAHLYPGIDLLFHADDSGLQLEHDFVLAPGADPKAIRFKMRAADAVSLRADGQLIIVVQGKSLLFHQPLAYQETPAGRVAVEAHFHLDSHGVVGFNLGRYDRRSPLTIDPVLSFATYLDGTNSDTLRAIASDASGNIYVAGATSSTDFPVSSAEASTNMGMGDAFISKLDPTGHTLIYSTYLGGSNTDEAESIAVDANGNVVVSGTSQSQDFPQAGQLTSTLSGYAETFVASLNAAGSTLRYAGFLGANSPVQQDTYTRLSRVVVDAQGNAYVAGLTNDPTFTVTSGAYGGPVAPYPSDSTLFLAKVQSDGSFGYRATIPQTPAQQIGSNILPLSIGNIAVDPTGAVILAGYAGNDLPTTAGTLSPAFPNSLLPDNATAGFALKLNPAGSALVFSTYLPGTDIVTDVALDSSGDIYLAGRSYETTLPTSANALQKTLTVSVGTPGAGFVFKLSSDGTTAMSATYFGGTTPQVSGGTAILGLVLDAAGNVDVGGATAAVDLPLRNPLLSIFSQVGSDDLFLAQLSADLSTLQFGTFLHASDNYAQFSALGVEPNGHILLAGSTISTLFPTTVGSFQPTPPPPANPQLLYRRIFIAGIDLSVAAPSLCFDTGRANFGAVGVNTVANATVNVTNCGNAPLTLTSVTASDPTVTATQSCSGIAPASVCQVLLAYAPTAAGELQGSLTLSGNNAISPQMLSYMGTAGFPQVTLPPSIEFGDLLVGQTGSINGVALGNDGVGPFILSSAMVTGDFQITQNTCASPVPQNGYCAISINFSPTAAGSRTGVLTLTDNLTPTVQTIQLSGNGLETAPAPTINEIVATPVGTSGIGALSVYGAGFFPNSTVLWNGQPRTTHYIGYDQISADLLPADTQQVGEAQVVVSTPAPGGGVSAASTAAIYGRLQNIQVVNEVFEPHSQLIYATISKTSPTNANSVVAIDPVAMKIVNTVLTGNSPDAIAVSDDGFMLYVGLDDLLSVTQISLPGGTQNFTLKLPAVSPSTDPIDVHSDLVASALKVVPGQPHTWVAGLCIPNGEPCGVGVAVFDDATIRPIQEIPPNLTADSLVFVNDPTVVYSTEFNQLPPDISAYKISSTGIQRTATNSYVGGGPLESDGSLIYDSMGEVIDPSTLTTQFAYPQAMSVYPQTAGFALDTANKRLYFAGAIPYNYQMPFIGSLVLSAVSQTTKSTIGRIGFTEESNATSVERFGSNGLAINQGNQVLFLQTSLTQIAAPVLSVTVSPASLSFGTATQGTTSAAKMVTVTNAGTGAVSISAISVTGDYSQTNHCGTSLAVGASCVISVSFTPTAVGDRTGRLTIADNAPGAPQTVSLDGAGAAAAPPLTLAPQSSGGNTATVAAGVAATYNLTLATTTYTGVVELSCAGAPALATCSIHPASLSVTAGASTPFIVTVTTGSSSSSSLSAGPASGPASRRRGERSQIVSAGLGLMALLSFPFIVSIRRRRSSFVRLMVLCFAIGFGLAGCGSGSPATISSQPNNVAAGTYQLTITATAGSQTTSEALTLTVK